LSDRGSEKETRAGRLPKELVDVDCPKCGFKFSQDTEVVFNREDQYFVGYNLTCPECGNEFSYTLYS
jgi:predicted RNA-binding Zn-ribbon protein involved in translation (DUF1610 family)